MLDNGKGHNNSIIIFIGTIVLCILLLVLIYGILNVSIVGNVCEQGSDSSFSCGGATTIQFQYDDSTIHTDCMIGIFFLIYTICIAEIVSYKSIHKTNGFSLISTFFIIVSVIVVITSTIFLVKDLQYGNKPHLSGNQVILNN